MSLARLPLEKIRLRKVAASRRFVVWYPWVLGLYVRSALWSALVIEIRATDFEMGHFLPVGRIQRDLDFFQIADP